LQLNHSGRYSCGGWVDSKVAPWALSAPVTVTVHGVPLSGVSLLVQPPGGQVALGDRLVLSCTVATGTGPLSFSWHREGSGAPLGTGPHLELWHAGDKDSSQYQCRVSDGNSMADSVPLNVTILGDQDPRANGDP
ncbi:FCRL2 protein, partial [Prunella fulvescens]|nr:FCRL2 protein [Prunella fulvescens]